MAKIQWENWQDFLAIPPGPGHIGGRSQKRDSKIARLQTGANQAESERNEHND